MWIVCVTKWHGRSKGLRWWWWPIGTITIVSSGALVCAGLRWGPFRGKDSDHSDWSDRRWGRSCRLLWLAASARRGCHLALGSQDRLYKESAVWEIFNWCCASDWVTCLLCSVRLLWRILCCWICFVLVILLYGLCLACRIWIILLAS